MAHLTRTVHYVAAIVATTTTIKLCSTLTQQRLEAFMLAATEQDVLMALGCDLIIGGVAESTELLLKLLIQR